MNSKLLSYQKLDTPIHDMSGFTKLICFVILSFATVFSFDIRVIFFVFVVSVIVFKMAKIKISDVKFMLIYVGVFIGVNFILVYLFAPEEGVATYGTRHVIVEIFGRYTITWEQIFYQVTKSLKMVAIIPMGIVFFYTTNPSELASSLNRAGVSYKVSFAVALTLRYIPDIQRDYQDISLAQQARGLDLSKKAPLSSRFKNALVIVIPLIFSTLERIETISNAMDLRRFGVNKKRSWYAMQDITPKDKLAITVSIIIFLGSIVVSVFINHSQYYNPFI